MLTLDRKTVRQLQRLHIRLEAPDNDSLVLRQVPIGPGFNAPEASLLLKRKGPDEPFLPLVTGGLEYRGADPVLHRALCSPPLPEGWRFLHLPGAIGQDLDRSVRESLAALGSFAPRPAPGLDPETTPLLAHFARAEASAKSPKCLLGRADELLWLATLMRCSTPGLPLLIGPTGVGKTALLQRAADDLQKSPCCEQVLWLDTARLPLAGVQALADLLEEACARPQWLLVAEDLHLLLATSAPGPGALLADAVRRGARLVGTVRPDTEDALATPELAPVLVQLPVPELGAEETNAAVSVAAKALTRRHEVACNADLCAPAVRLAADLPGAFPGKAITLLDAAMAAAAATGSQEVSADDLYFCADQLRRSKPGSP